MTNFNSSTQARQYGNLVRSRNDRMIAGVLGGFAEHFGVSATLLRVLFVASFLMPGPQFLVYIAAWIIMPKA